MYQIKTSDFFNHTLDKELRDIDIVRNLSEDSFATGSSILYAIYSSKYKIEFCFKENRKLHYIMIEELSEQGDNKNIALEYIDDLNESICYEERRIRNSFRTAYYRSYT